MLMVYSVSVVIYDRGLCALLPTPDSCVDADDADSDDCDDGAILDHRFLGLSLAMENVNVVPAKSYCIVEYRPCDPFGVPDLAISLVKLMRSMDLFYKLI